MTLTTQNEAEAQAAFYSGSIYKRRTDSVRADLLNKYESLEMRKFGSWLGL